MQVKFYLDSRNDTGWMDTECLGYSDDEWKALSDDQKMKEVIVYFESIGYPDYGFEEKEV